MNAARSRPLPRSASARLSPISRWQHHSPARPSLERVCLRTARVRQKDLQPPKLHRVPLVEIEVIAHRRRYAVHLPDHGARSGSDQKTGVTTEINQRVTRRGRSRAEKGRSLKPFVRRFAP